MNPEIANHAVVPLATNYISATGTAGVNNTAQDVKTIAIRANALTEVGDRIRCRIYFTGDTGASVLGTVKLNGVTIATSTSGTGVVVEVIECWMQYIDQTQTRQHTLAPG